MAHETMEYSIQAQLDNPASEAVPEVSSSQGGPLLLQPAPIEAVSNQGGPLLLQPAPVEAVSSQGGPLLLQPAPVEAVSSQGGPLLLQPAPVEVVSSQGGPLLLQPAPVEAVSSQGGPLLLQPAPVEAVSSQGGPLLLPPIPVEVVSRQEQPPFLQPIAVDVVSSQGTPSLFQPVPAEMVNSHLVAPLFQPAPQVATSLTEEVELAREASVDMNPGASEERRQIPGAARTPRGASLESVNSFINGLQRLHGMLEFLRPSSSDHNVGPLRVRRRGSASRRARAGGSQRTDNTRLRAPLDTYFQVSRTQPHLSAVSDNSETRNPVSEDLHLSSGSDSDSDSSAENEEVVAQVEEPGAVILEEQVGGVSAEQEVTCASEGKTISKQSPNGSNPLVPSTSADDEEGDTCTICLEQWTNAGEHRLTALRCGHLFGYKCISKWLKGQARKCPQCNKKAKHSDIVVLYARNLRALDTSEQEHLRSSLLKEQMLRKQAELESAQCRLQLQVLTDECTKLHSRVQDLQSLIMQHKEQALQRLRGSPAQFLSCQSSSQGQRKYHFQKTFPVSQTGNCRIMEYCETLSCLVVSQPSPQASFLPGFGVRMLSTANMKSSQYIPMHGKQIRGLAFNPRSKGLLLSASLDNTVKLTSLETNTVVQTYNTGRPVWSCCWCLDENYYLYAGLVNGSILVYDMRITNSHVQELVPQKARCPLVSLSYIPKAASAAFPYGGVLAGTLENASFWVLRPGFSHWPHVLPLEQGGCIDFQTESSTRHCLVTYRPDKNHSTMRSVLMQMSYRLDDAGEPVCSCNPVQTFHGGPTCKLLTKNAIFQSPEHDGSILVCTGDEASNSALLWDASNGSKLQDLQTDHPVLDICPFEVNHNSYLATLTEKMVHLYRWE